ncbi:MAG: zinc-dependent metalloprotease [Rhodothermia bacterium]|nr:MAG: zinc-dependent metalloprotease [Rhodothermia bacterium]
MSNFRLFVLLPLLSLSLISCASSKRASTSETGADTTSSEDYKDQDEIKAFKDVIKDDFEKDEGLFNVYKDDATYYYEIPNNRLDQELLLVTRIARTANNIGYGGEKANTQVVRWVRNDDKIFLRIVSYTNVADEKDPIYRAVRNSNLEPILFAFDIKAYNADTTGVIVDVSKLFTSDVAALGLPAGRRSNYKVRRLDSERTYISSIKSFPTNIEVRHVLTYDATAAPSNRSSNSITLEMNQSMIELPADPMKPRLCDNRVGLISVSMTNYSSDEQKAKTVCYVTRWRLEPKDKEAYARGELVEPVKQIVYYIDPATPEKWRPYIKQGVDDWNKSFEAAGFKNTIRGAYPPSPEEDPEFSPEDARYSVIRYFSSADQNAFGPHVHDPRTGEILESDIRWFHNVQNLLRNWYLIQTAAVNPDAQKVKFDDDVMGELIRFVAAHEVGHTLGFQHNMGSSNAYTIEQLRSPEFTSTHGVAPSIMDNARFNYVAQPGDGVTQFGPMVGEYDDWATKWTYSWFDDDLTPQEERELLNEWTVERADDPAMWFGSGSGDPRVQTEDISNDPIEASNLGIENLKRILDNLIEWTAENGKTYDDLKELYNNVTSQWSRYVGHVSNVIGGVYETYKTYDQSGVVYEPVEEEKQRAAMQWMNDQVFTAPEWMIREDILRRFEGTGTVNRIRRYQVGGLNRVLNLQKMARMIEAEAMLGDDTYTISELFSDLRGSVFSELRRAENIGGYRRALQRGYVERLQTLMDSEAGSFLSGIDVSQSDIRMYVRGELETLKGQVDRASGRTRDNATRLHLRDLSERIDDVLNPND